jgi:hypothetical protein
VSVYEAATDAVVWTAVDNASCGMRMASSACWDTPVPVVTVCMCGGDAFTTVRGDDLYTQCPKVCFYRDCA